MRSFLALAVLVALAACSGSPSTSTPSTIPATTLQQQSQSSPLTCKFKRFTVTQIELRRGQNHGVLVRAHRPNAYVTYSVWNHLEESAVNVWPFGDQSAMITVQPRSRTGNMKLSSPVRAFVIQKVTRGKDSGPNVTLNGMVCPQT